MNSFNHYSFGAVGAWMYNYSLGIRRDPASPGFRHFILEPVPDPDGVLTFARGYYDSPYGRIASAWEIDGTATVYRFTVPPNTMATLHLAAGSLKQVTLGGRRLKKAAGVSGLKQGGGRVQLELASGTYEFRVAN
jgi:alpha-L-rhamnosidase